MPKFKVRFEREVVETDFFEREIEASTEEEARKVADQMAHDANLSCPDDVSTYGGADCGDWDVDEIIPEVTP